jgi:hypothetical protein
MKKVFVLLLAAGFSLSLYAKPVDVSKKVLKVFNETYSNAKDVKWGEVNDMYTVSFSMSGILTKLVYDKDGAVVSSLRYYQPEYLPINIQNSLTRRFAGKKLYGVTEVGSSEGMVYFVKIYDAKFWYTVRVDSDGTSEVTEKLRRADLGLM